MMIVCPDCGKQFEKVESGYFCVIFGKDNNPVYGYFGDKFVCPGCKFEVMADFGDKIWEQDRIAKYIDIYEKQNKLVCFR